MSETNGGDLAPLNCVGHLEAIARDVESVDASVPILCGIVANRLYAMLGATVSELPEIVDHPREIARLLSSVTGERSDRGRGPSASQGRSASLGGVVTTAWWERAMWHRERLPLR